MQVIAECKSVDEALPVILKEHPELIFLDIQMPQKSGFELVSELHDLNIDIPVIFVTAFDEFAIQAIKASALEYLLKPIDHFELAKAIEKFRFIKEKDTYKEKLDELLIKIRQPLSSSSRIRFNIRTGYILVDPIDILYLEADGNYTHLFLRGDKKETISSNMGTIEKTLPELDFKRISRSLILNSRYLTKVDRFTHQCQLAVDGKVIYLKFSGNDID